MQHIETAPGGRGLGRCVREPFLSGYLRYESLCRGGEECGV